MFLFQKKDSRVVYTVVGVYINKMKTTVDSIFFISDIDTHKHGNKEQLSINNFSLFTCKFVI